jgi:omega-6 fatty acid desaturase (delta-12 desaturase)
VTPIEVVAVCDANGHSLGSLRQAIPRELHALQPIRSWLGLVRSWLIIAAGEALLWHLHVDANVQALWQVPALILAWFVVASGMVGLFILGHDCGHDSFSDKKWINTAVGYLCMSPILTGFHNWRIAHAHHHARAGLRKDDTDWPEDMRTQAEHEAAPFIERLKLKAAYASPAGLMLGFLIGMVRRSAMATLYPQVKLTARGRRELFFSNLAMVIVSGGIGATLVHFFGVVMMLKLYAVPLYFGMILGAFFTYLHHTGEGAVVFDAEGWSPVKGQVGSTFDVRFPAWFEALFFHINRHPPHHLATRIPWYHLPRAMDALREAHPELHLERRFSLGYMWRAWRNPLLKQVQPGVFVMSRES